MTTKQELMKIASKYSFKNEVTDDKVILTLSGPVAQESFFTDKTINAQDIAETLDGVDKDIVIRLNSPGGDAFQGIEIYNYLKNHKSHITVEVTALAASAASIIAMAADELVMCKGSSLMIHEASTIAIGNKSEVKKVINALETVDASIVEVYKDKTGLDTDEIEQLMSDETWFTAQQAVDKGFADKLDMVETPKETESTEAKDEYVAAMMNEVENLKSELAMFKNNHTPKKKRYL
ncbi:Clp protease ClpP [Staphylococcus pseudintermedius]|uniref:head maturation protease, ClpP-related n=1 Tax=Staphylococcus pseudintermedius TaxID=283734 RepID=UPI000C1C1F45|nr:head maturation protease, ClpP-related [Staphylococcus pseudintermedius]EGQ0314118.1 Clp protease ClpP [Staphylococcus pseudintermedius]EGQ0379309.1 Clp protease ClpP [Staphylococcus pseudintermedius]EGQ0389622.1 Clp protease ClpP [Staphylococcus pseudintermedius]EGQ1640322.1 Clp protease ClpP [Staphylococcus pseudintermedius]EGQ1675943.1 Clp protease ClpP [Staphylococcus pseudintermedius]